MKQPLHTRLLCLLLAAALMLGLFPTVSAAPPGLRWEISDTELSWDRSDRLITDTSAESLHKPTDMVRVSIVLERTPTLRAGFHTMDLSSSADAAAYDLALHKAQKSMERTISAQALGGKSLDVVWNLTLVSNIISANVPYGRIDAIRDIKGVRDVVIERRYTADLPEPQTATSTTMTGAPILWQSGLTGSGSRIAIIDTGTDTDHQSFDNGAYLYALSQNAMDAGMDYETYYGSLDLLDAAEIGSVLEHLNAYERIGTSAEQFYINEKLPFGANYVDRDLTVNHDWDGQGSHGSHVAGIAAANRYVPRDNGYADAIQTVQITGVAPDAQIVTMKVFGNAEGPYDSDYFAAIEDAIWLGCDSVNLSLGTANPGYSENPLFDDLLDYLATTDTVVVISAGNSGTWADATTNGYLYHDGVSFQTAGAPGTYTNSLTVASVENDGTIGNYLDVAGRTVVYTEGSGYYNNPMTSLDTSYDDTGTDYDYILIDGLGYPSDYEGMDLFGKVVFCSRGDISFAEKATNAVQLGAAAVVIYNNTSGVFGMDLSGYYYSAPCVSILQKDADAIRSASEQRTTSGGIPYYTGTLNISRRLGVSMYDSEYDTLSSFSSWGVPGSLELKPEITAPGGLIWSVNGVDPSGTGYEMMSGTSMAAPQVSGMAALVAEYIRTNDLDTRTGLSPRKLAQSLLMSTAQPLRELESGGEYYSILAQGAGLARVDLAASAESYILVRGMSDGKVKVELGEDPQRTGCYDFTFSIHNLTDRELLYTLSADLFTQDVFDGGDGNLYLDTWTTSLGADARFFVDGVPVEGGSGSFSHDLNGDGNTTDADADYLLEYLVGNVDTLYADGDVDGDGLVTSHDAHALLNRPAPMSQVAVPADGSVTVDVRLELTPQTMKELDENYPTGAYIEAFVYAEPVTDDEGDPGITHSIPVLGYYGSWTEPSMYDVGSYPEYLSGSESRAPYLYETNDIQNNFISISHGGREEYLFGGNPIATDESYLPQRNAFNNQKGWVLDTMYVSLIRNAAASMLLLENADTGEVYLAQELDPMEGAYYHVNAGVWQNTSQRLSLGLDLSGYTEGTRLNLSLVTAPELYCTYDPAAQRYTADWDALGEGAYLTTSITIDNTAPELGNVELGEDNILRVTAKDNQYISAVAVMNPSGTSILAAASANQTEPDKEMTLELDMSQVFGSEFKVVVFDYAENAVSCDVTLELDTQRPYFTVLECDTENNTAVYTGLDSDGSLIRMASTGRELPIAAEYAEGAVFEITSDNKLYAALDADLYRSTYLGDLDPGNQWQITTFCDMAYNRMDGCLYALFYSNLNNQTVPYLCTIDMFTGAMTVLGQMPIDMINLAIDGDGNFYGVGYAANELYRYTADVVTTGDTEYIGATQGYRTYDISSLAWDHNSDRLYWFYNAGNTHALVELSTTNARPRLVCSCDFTGRGLYIAYEPESELFAPTDNVTAVTMEGTAFTLVGSTVQLSAAVAPWTVSDPSLIWTSSNPSVASVDGNGLVSGHAEGTAVITAASSLDSSVSASCTVTVTSLDIRLNGLVWDPDGNVWWSTFTADSIPDYDLLCPDPASQPLNATLVADGKLYASSITNYGSDLYLVDRDTYELSHLGSSGVSYCDLAYAPSMDCGLAVYSGYVVQVDLQTGGYISYMPWLTNQNGALVGIAYYGTEYNSYYDTDIDYFLLLDSKGNVYLDAWIENSNMISYFHGPEEGYLGTIGAPVDIEYLQGFHYDGTYVYWTRFNEADDAVELIVWDINGTGSACSAGWFDDAVWPVGGLFTDDQFDGIRPLESDRLGNAQFRSVEQPGPLSPVSGSLNSAAVTDTQEETIALTITAPENTAGPTNGTITVTYDPADLELLYAVGTTTAHAWNPSQEGTVTIAFAERSALSDGAALTDLIFRPLGTGDTTVTIEYGQWNQGELNLHQELKVELPEEEPPEEEPPEQELPFTDLVEGEYYIEPVLWAVENGITNGYTATTFNPDGKCTRAQVVTFLWRAEGKPQPTSTSHPFTDLDEDEYYMDAVLWAVENGITNGYSATTFEPDRECTRAQVVTFLHRAANKPEPTSTSHPFTDLDETEYYMKAVLWAVENGITNGYTATTFEPDMECTRAQVVTFLYRAKAE